MFSEGRIIPPSRISLVAEVDLGAIMEIERESFPQPGSLSFWLRELTNAAARTFVARLRYGEREEIAGYLNYWAVAGEAQLNAVAVRKGWRRMEIASRLMREMMDRCADESLTAATLEVRRSNRAAIHLYEKFGFVVKGVRKNYYDECGEDGLIMWADIG